MFIVNVEGAIFKEDKWLMIKRSNKEEHAGGSLSLVGGKVELEGNTIDILERTLRREISEEVGVNVSNTMNYICSTSFVTEKGEHVVDVVFLCEYESGEAYARAKDEVEDVFWLSSEEVLAHPNNPDFLKAYIQQAQLLKTKLMVK